MHYSYSPFFIHLALGTPNLVAVFSQTYPRLLLAGLGIYCGNLQIGKVAELAPLSPYPETDSPQWTPLDNLHLESPNLKKKITRIYKVNKPLIP